VANIAKLSVLLSANTSRFSSGMKGASKHVTSFQRSAMSAKTAILGLASAFGVYRAAAGFKSMVQDSMKSLDAVGKLSDRTGMATENIIAMQHAATLAGSSADDFNASLMRFVRRIGDAADGSGEAVAGLEALGLSAKELSQLKIEQALGLVSDKLRMVGDVGIRTDAAFKLFGDSAFRMMNFLTMGSEAFNKARQSADELGATMDDIGIDKIIDANDAIGNMKAAFQGVANRIAEISAPYLTEMADNIRAATLSTIDGCEAQASSWALVAEAISKAITALIKFKKLADIGIAKTIAGAARTANWFNTPISAPKGDPWGRFKALFKIPQHKGEEGSWLDNFADAMDDQTQAMAKSYQKYRNQSDSGAFSELRKRAQDIAGIADGADLPGEGGIPGIDEIEGPGDAGKAFEDLLGMFSRVHEEGPEAFQAAADGYQDMLDTMSGGPVGGAAAQGKFLGVGPAPSVMRGTGPQPIGTAGFEAVQPAASRGTRGTNQAGAQPVTDQGTHDLLRALLTRGAVAVVG